jgi:PASTA domain
MAAAVLESSAASLTLWLVVGFVLLGGIVAAFGRSLLEGSFKSRSGSGPDKGGTGRATPDRTFMRSWLALALVGGLLIFAAVSFQLDDTALRSSLLGGVIASAGAATAFYFASKSSDQARQDILNASVPTVTAPSLIGKTKAEVNAALAGAPLYLDALPTTASDTWTAVSQYPQPNQQTPSGSRVNVTFAGDVPDLNNLTRTAAEAKLSTANLMLTATPANAAPDSTAQADQAPAAGDPPPLNRTVTVSFH